MTIIVPLLFCIIWQHLYRARDCQPPWTGRWNFDVICHYSGVDISISGFDGYIVISGCRLLLKLLADTFFELSAVVNPRFAV